jgi:hypothetical protein
MTDLSLAGGAAPRHDDASQFEGQTIGRRNASVATAGGGRHDRIGSRSRGGDQAGRGETEFDAAAMFVMHETYRGADALKKVEIV